MEKRLELISDVNLLSFIILGIIRIFNWSPLLCLIPAGLAVVTLIMGIISLLQRNKYESGSQRKYLWRILWQLFVSAGLLVISGCSSYIL